MHRDHGVLDGLRPLLIARSVDTPLHARGELARAEIGLDDGGLGHYRTAARLTKREASSGASPRVSDGTSWPSTLQAAGTCSLNSSASVSRRLVDFVTGGDTTTLPPASSTTT